MKTQLDIFDSLEFLRFENQCADYPNHYHESYCISLIEAGALGENELVAPRGSMLISHPYEVHRNSALGNSGVDFSTFYVSQDVVDYISPFGNTSFQHKVIQVPILVNQLKKLIKLIISAKPKKDFFKAFYAHFYEFISQVARVCGSDRAFAPNESFALLAEVKQSIAKSLTLKIDLSSLAKICDMSKFQFIRWFKQHLGMTPFEYILLQRVEYSKQLIQQGVPLVDVAVGSGFYDQSHFSRYFKKYVGTSPKAYGSSCNILQDL